MDEHRNRADHLIELFKMFKGLLGIAAGDELINVPVTPERDVTLKLKKH